MGKDYKIEDWFLTLEDQYILFEITDYCNLNCKMCSHYYIPGPHQKKKTFLKPSLFKKILFSLPPKEKHWAIKLFWLGEPLLHPQFDQILEIALNYIKTVDKKAYLDIHTNGIFLKRFTSPLLKCSSHLPHLTVSLDAIFQKTYSKIRRGYPYLSRIYDGIIQFLKKRKEKFPALILQFIFMKDNQQEVFQFIHFWQKILKLYGQQEDFIFIKKQDLHFKDAQEKYNTFYYNFLKEVEKRKKSLDWNNLKIMDYSPFSQTKIENNSQKHSKKKDIPDNHKRPKICTAPWKTPVINSNGEITICCFDSFLQYSLGNLKGENFSSLWFGEKIKKIRKFMKKGELDKIKTNDGIKRCYNCTGVTFPQWKKGELEII